MPRPAFALPIALTLVVGVVAPACKSKKPEADAKTEAEAEAKARSNVPDPGLDAPKVRPQPPKFEPKVEDLKQLERESWMPQGEELDGAEELEALTLTYTNLCGRPVEYAFTATVEAEVDPEAAREIPAHTRREVEIPKGWFLRTSVDGDWAGGVTSEAPKGHVWVGGPGCTSRGAMDDAADDPAALPQRWGRPQAEE